MDEVKAKLDAFLKEVDSLGYEMKVDMVFKASILDGMSDREKVILATVGRSYFDPVVQFVEKKKEVQTRERESQESPIEFPIIPEVVA